MESPHEVQNQGPVPKASVHVAQPPGAATAPRCPGLDLQLPKPVAAGALQGRGAGAQCGPAAGWQEAGEFLYAIITG